MIIFVKKSLFAILLLASALSGAAPVWAGEYTVRPFLIEKTLLPRDVVTEPVLLTNDNPARKYVIYATVNEISMDQDGEIREFVSPVMTDRSVTVTSWIEVTRGRIEIPPGEQREVPITVRVSPNAEPGTYYAFVGFVPAPNRPTAENIAMAGEADGVIVKVEIADKRNDSMRIAKFLISRFITGETQKTITIEVENLGDIASVPAGEIIFYDSRGVEISSTPVNTEAVSIAPGDTAVLESSVPIEGTLGRFKANLSLEYGERQRATLHDTATFFLMPLPLLIALFVAILVVSVLVAFLFRRAFMQEEFHEEADEVTMYVRDGHAAEPQDHDIDLSNKTE